MRYLTQMCCFTAKSESFIYNRNLGSCISEIDLDTENAKEKVELLLNESLAEFENTYVKVLEIGERLKREVIIGDERRVEEVYLNGNV